VCEAVGLAVGALRAGLLEEANIVEWVKGKL
jgi:hypothetical protein